MALVDVRDGMYYVTLPDGRQVSMCPTNLTSTTATASLPPAPVPPPALEESPLRKALTEAMTPAWAR